MEHEWKECMIECWWCKAGARAGQRLGKVGKGLSKGWARAVRVLVYWVKYGGFGGVLMNLEG